jgi:HEPN domain-containing protein/predicted nucleotidyltransferase
MLKTLEEIRERVVSVYNPDRIILFGSRAAGTNTDESDYDLLILKDTSARPIDRRVEVEKILQDRAVPLDILVYTPQEMSYLYSIGSPFIEEVIETGRVLYMRKATGDWIREAEEELASARILFEHDKWKAACYHSQQGVEKGLKALILEKGEKPGKVHDIVELLGHANRLGWQIALAMDDAIFLNSIYKGRYPAEEGLLPRGDPAKEDAARAVKTAGAFIAVVKAVLA